jgi:hypothetical protein
LAEKMPYHNEKLLYLLERCSEHQPVLPLELCHALHAGVL